MFCWCSSLFCLSQSETGVKVVGVWKCANSNNRPEITWMAEIRMSNKESLENYVYIGDFPSNVSLFL